VRSRILVASGDDSVRKMITATMLTAGHQVLEVSTGDAAASAAIEPRMGVALAILDGQYPPIAGNQVLRTIREAGIDIPVILASGSFILDGLPADDRVAFLSKPFDLSELRELVVNMLARDRPES
jgi:DNA-binding response OmpR family regulator